MKYVSKALSCIICQLEEFEESVNRKGTDNTMAERKEQKDKQRSTKHTHKTRDRVTQRI